MEVIKYFTNYFKKEIQLFLQLMFYTILLITLKTQHSGSIHSKSHLSKVLSAQCTANINSKITLISNKNILLSNTWSEIKKKKSYNIPLTIEILKVHKIINYITVVAVSTCTEL